MKVIIIIFFCILSLNTYATVSCDANGRCYSSQCVRWQKGQFCFMDCGPCVETRKTYMVSEADLNKKMSDVDTKIETLVLSINNLGTELKTGIVIELLKNDPQFQKIIEDAVEAKMKANSEGDDAASNND